MNHLYNLVRLCIITAFIATATWLIGGVLMVIFASVMVAVILYSLSQLISRLTKLPYLAALTIILLSILLLIVGLVWHSGPEITSQIVKLKAAISLQTQTLHTQLKNNPMGEIILRNLPHYLTGNQLYLDNSNANIGQTIAGSMTSMITSMFGVLGTILVILMAGFYFAISPSTYTNGILKLVPLSYRNQVRDLLFIAGKTLTNWTLGQGIDMLVVGTLSGIGLWCIGIPLSLALGIVAGLCNFIPYIGAIMGAVPAIILGLSVSLQSSLLVLALYIVIQFFEGNIITPLIQRHAVHMPPGLTILSQTFFGTILGITGLIFASPLTAVLLAIGKKLTEKEKDT